ncbi:MAG: GNAT family N-acetyltransferase [Actinomycetota bacterium]|nr:GNAT family N-acetyltransferase [Actinomycetota bacterium]
MSATLRHGPAYTRAFGTRLPRALALLTRMQSRHPRQAHHYFAFIGVAPERQGAGLGTRLMAPTLRSCDAAGLPAYLEASSARMPCSTRGSASSWSRSCTMAAASRCG